MEKNKLIEIILSLGAQTIELQEIILQIRALIDSDEPEDFIISRINTILFEWR